MIMVKMSVLSMCLCAEDDNFTPKKFLSIGTI